MNNSDELLFTPAALLSLLTQIDELKDVDIGLVETLDNAIQLQVGESTYELEFEHPTDIQVDESQLDAIDDANASAYESLSEDGEVVLDEFEGTEPIQSGIIKELAKTLLIGGMVRLSAKLLK